MQGKHILVLDDEAPVRALLQKILTDAGYRVTAVGDGQSALRAARDDPPDLLVCDLSMPGLNGFHVMMMLKRSFTFEAPIIVVSGLSKEKDELEARQAGADTFLRKPVDRDRLLAEIGKLLEPRFAPPDPALARKHILVLEDDARTRVMLEMLLRNCGYRVTGVGDGTTAFELFRKQPPDLLLCDLVVPGMQGMDLIRALRGEMDFKGPIIVVSGRSHDSVETAVLAAGADSFLPKPISRQLLLHHVADYLSRSPG
ncbi:response regulator [candidate division WOR-3 bacterium]|nr:response regulator [candidate division WOR-3 bacterium]